MSIDGSVTAGTLGGAHGEHGAGWHPKLCFAGFGYPESESAELHHTMAFRSS